MLDEVKSLERTGGVHYYAGMAQGIYEEEGIRLRVLSGIPSYVSAKYVSLEENALDSFGQADTALTLLAMTEDLPLRCVAGILSNVIAIASLGSKGVKKPKDLEGRKVGVAVGTGESMMLPLLAQLNGADFGKVKVVNVGPGNGKTLERGPQALM
jgi:NitT/TauT family transport system substrate-binding protein